MRNLSQCFGELVTMQYSQLALSRVTIQAIDEQGSSPGFIWSESQGWSWEDFENKRFGRCDNKELAWDELVNSLTNGSNYGKDLLIRIKPISCKNCAYYCGNFDLPCAVRPDVAQNPDNSCIDYKSLFNLVAEDILPETRLSQNTYIDGRSTTLEEEVEIDNCIPDCTESSSNFNTVACQQLEPVVSCSCTIEKTVMLVAALASVLLSIAGYKDVAKMALAFEMGALAVGISREAVQNRK